MNMTSNDLDYAHPPADEPRPIIGWLEGSVLAAAGILMPMVCFAASFNRYPGGPEFQRGWWLDYLTLVPSVGASWPFAPLLFAATFAMAILVISPHRVVRSWLLRGALYSGAILSAQYTLIQAIAVVNPSAPLNVETLIAIVAAAIATLLALGALWIVPRLPRIRPAYFLPGGVLIPLAAIACWRIALPAILLSAMLIAIIAPAITLAAYVRVLLIVGSLSQRDGQPARRIGLRVPLAWLATYAIAWFFAFMNAIELYNLLPKRPPDC